MINTLFKELDYPRILWDKKVGSGIDCICYSTEEYSIVFKAFRDKQKVEVIYNNQLEAASAGLAPLLYSPILKVKSEKSGYYNGEVVYGFYTERVLTEYDDEVRELSRGIFLRMKEELTLSIETFFKAPWRDAHEGNIGVKLVDGNLKMVCIDFGINSFWCNYSLNDNKQKWFEFMLC